MEATRKARREWWNVVSVGPAGNPLSERVGDYQLLDTLGSGGMGTVYKARAPDGRLVAVKVVRPEYAEDREFRARFQHEARAAQRVPRQWTAQVLGAHLDGELLYLVTEFVDGPTLQESVRQDGPWPLADTEQLGLNVASALAAIHEAQVVHRDLKPSNVLLSRSGPRVIDFGIARALDATTGLTRTTQVLGTPGFMAPEQWQNQRITPAVDVFAWGALMVFAATGRPPFGSGDAVAQAYRAVHHEPVLTGLEGRLRELAATALRKDPAERPTARELVKMLDGGSSELHTPTAPQEPHPAVSSDRAYLSGPTGRRRGMPTAARVAAVAVVVAVLALTGIRLLQVGGASDGSVASGIDLGGVSISVGSKEFTEQQILGQIMSQALAAAGADVNQVRGGDVRDQLESGQVDAYYEYTSTAWITEHDGTPLETEEAQFEAVRDADAEQGIVWLAPAPANNTYTLVTNAEAARELNPATISDYARIAGRDPQAAALCVDEDTLSPSGVGEELPGYGLAGLEEHYGFTLPRELVTEVETEDLYPAVAGGAGCDFAIGASTSGRIPAQDLTVLEDDLGFFANYNVAVTMRQEVYEPHAEDYGTLFTAVSAALTNEKLRELNAAVALDRQDAATVAEAFLRDAGII